MANRIPLVVVSSEQLIKELPEVDDLDLANSSIRNVATANVGNINVTSLIVTTANASTVNSATLIGSTANLSTVNTSSLIILGTTTLEEVLEKSNITATAMGANVNFDVLDSAVVYYTSNATANSTLNIRGNTSVNLNSVMAANQAMTIAFAVTTGATAFRVANLQIDGTSITPRWSGGSAPTATANSTEVYSFTVFKTASATYTVLGSKTSFA
jgi:hypothetical protein